MSREIKFRVWDKEHQEWCGADVQMIKAKNGHFVTGMFDSSGTLEPLTAYSDDSRFELMQYTGLKDKNGVEIYEGDLLRFGSPRETFVPLEPADTVGQVVFTYGGFNVARNGLGEVTDWHECEVIGNIYEHPELLEGK